ncbi:MAG: restriction endonuclease subunit S, partial [Propionibacteriaceae bacterium]|nr:restriction endonuclease subunit S [Propionibacteriaceae bacterium]
MVDPRSGEYDNLPHVGPGNIEPFTGHLLENVHTVRQDNLISGKFHFDKDDVIYSKIRPELGKYIYAVFEGLASADAYVLNAKGGLTQRFLFALLQTQAFYDYTVSVSMRSGMPKVNRDELNAFEFISPSVQEQERIGELLLTLDHLITLHQRE